MATYTGQIQTDLIGRPLDERSYLSINVQTADDNVYNPEVYIVPGAVPGELLVLPPASLIHDLDGAVQDSVNSPFYDRYLYVRNAAVIQSITARVVSYGDQLVLALWNGFPTKDTVTSIVISQPLALSISGISIGTGFNEYEEKNILIEILDTAPIEIDCLITVGFSSGAFATIRLTGIIAAVALVRSQMSGFLEFISFMTDVITSRSGEEQRIALRKFPRYSISTSAREYQQPIRNTLKNVLTGQSSVFLGFAFWQMSSYASPVTAGSDTVLVDTSYAIYQQEYGMIIRESGTSDFEVATIKEVNADNIVLETDLDNTYANPIVAPYYFMKTSSPRGWTDRQNYSEYDIDGEMTFPVPVDDLVLDVYKGEGVIPYTCNLFEGGTARTTITDAFSEYDNLTGTFSKKPIWESSKVTVQFGIHAQSREDAFELRQLIYTLTGRQKTVWVPSFQHDFTLTEDLGGSILTCENNGYSTYVFGEDSLFKNVAVYRDGEVPTYATITAAEVNGSGKLELTLDQSLSATPKDQVKVSLMVLGRQTSDTAELSWETVNDCYTILEFTSVKE